MSGLKREKVKFIDVWQRLPWNIFICSWVGLTGLGMVNGALESHRLCSPPVLLELFYGIVLII